MTDSTRILGIVVLLNVSSLCLAQGQHNADAQVVNETDSAPSRTDPVALRRLTVDDLLILESVDEVVPSPDGDWFAVVIIRGRTLGEIYGRESVFEGSRADVWLISHSGGEARNLTRGQRDGSGYWSPVWSPDSRRLAVLSTAGGDNVRPYVIDWATGATRRLSERGIDLELIAGAGGARTRRAMAWTSDSTVLLSLLPEGEVSLALTLSSPSSHASLTTPGWEHAEKGQVPTASVLEAGIEIGEEARPTRDLVSINTASGHTDVLARGHFTSVRISPDGSQVAVTAATSAVLPDPRRLLSHGAITPLGLESIPMHGRLGLISAASSASVQWVAGLLDPEPYAYAQAAKWSEDGKWLAAIGKDEPGEESVATTPFVVSAETSRAKAIGPRAFRALNITWAGSWLLVRGVTPGTPSDRADWWAWDSRDTNGQLHRINDFVSGIPERLWTIRNVEGAVGFAVGDLWLIEPKTGRVTKLTSSFTPVIEQVLWPASEETGRFVTSAYGLQTREPVASVLISARSAGASRLYRLEFKTGARRVHVTAVSSPHVDAQLSAYAARTNTAAFELRGPNGTFVWTGRAGRDVSFHRRLALNEHLAGIVEGERRTFTYLVDGQPVYGMIILPVGYQEGRRYPLITRVYPGVMISESGHPSGRKEYPSAQHNLQVFAGRNYAVLYPSIPFPAGTDAISPITKHVLAAVDKVIEMGIADPTRLGISGHSQGSYATLAVLTQSDRFQAAAVAAVHGADMFDLYSQFWVMRRYLSFAHELHQPSIAYVEGRMRATPWDDPQRYVRNSPLSYVQQIHTPLLILHGEFDLPMGHAEAVFTSLYRLGRRARFVRYWGEGHNLDSPANIRDAWNQVFQWFDEHLKKGAGS